MKKVTLMVPDRIEHFTGSRLGSRIDSEDVTPENILQALCDRSEYHQYYYFKYSDTVNVVSIDEVKGK